MEFKKVFIEAPMILDGIIERELVIKSDKKLPEIKDVRFNGPATIVFWKDGSEKTVVKCDNEMFDKEKGLAMAIIKKINNNKGNYNDIFRKWCGEY